jgi:hypothetical protein
MKPILETFDPATRETLITWCQTERTLAAVSQRAAKPIAEGGLNLRISPSTLCRLYTTHNIADSKEARAQYAASLGLECKKLRLLQGTRENIEQRLFEITARPDATVAELRLAAQFIHRADSLSLAQRRVRVAEKRETRIAKLTEPAPVPTLEEADRRIHILLGKDFAKDPIPQPAQTADPGTRPPFPSANVEDRKLNPDEPGKPTSASPAPTPNSAINPPSPQSKFFNHQSSIVNPSNEDQPAPDKPTQSPTPQNPSTSSVPSVVNQSAIHIPQSAIDSARAHADRSYPAIHSPKSPSHAKLYEAEKQRCYLTRLRIETENALNSHLVVEPQAASNKPSPYGVPPLGGSEINHPPTPPPPTPNTSKNSH